jgi:hypothetical protein
MNAKTCKALRKAIRTLANVATVRDPQVRAIYRKAKRNLRHARARLA